MRILNLTQHKATPSQKEAGVFDLPEEKREALKRTLTFDEMPNLNTLRLRAEMIGRNVQYRYPSCDAVMIGGAPYFMPVLQAELQERRIKVLYAFSKRECIEVNDGDTVKKTFVFKHEGFIHV